MNIEQIENHREGLAFGLLLSLITIAPLCVASGLGYFTIIPCVIILAVASLITPKSKGR